MRNLLLIVYDTARADHFEPWGAAPGSTPVASDLARRGSAPPAVIAPSNWTVPSHASMFTGLLPASLGAATWREASFAEQMTACLETHRDRLIAEALRRRGFATAAISANPWIHPKRGFSIGFDRFISVKDHRTWPGKSLRSRIAFAMDAWRARADDGAAEAGQILRGWINEVGADAPFFWFVNLMECHGPYQPPLPYNDLGGIGRILAARDAARYQTDAGNVRVSSGMLVMDGATIERTRRLYSRAIYQMDAWLGGILEEMDRARILDDTLIVLASDHGENLGEQGLLGHVLTIADRVLRVPLVFSSPLGTTRSGPYSLAELPQLIAPLIGLDAGDHPWHDDLAPHGLAVSQVISRKPAKSEREQAVATGLSEETIRRLTSPMSSATDGRFKLVRDATGEHVYDLIEDPDEMRPLDPGTHADIATFRAALERLDALAREEGPAAPTPDAPPDDENAELEESLRRLGYL